MPGGIPEVTDGSGYQELQHHHCCTARKVGQPGGQPQEISVVDMKVCTFRSGS